ncbi:nuclear transport factor 2 family protein [Microbacterium sp. A588]
MDAGTALRGLMTAIDQKRWDDLESFLHPEFLCRYVHTGESFGRAEWIRVNRDYPGFAHLKVEELVASPTEAACRSRVTGRDDAGIQHFECASFARMRDGLIVQLTEVWTDVEQTAPAGTRPGGAGA